ncbi:MAG: hypothetical protein R2764_24880 [Bacteroidales bacterium]
MNFLSGIDQSSIIKNMPEVCAIVAEPHHRFMINASTNGIANGFIVDLYGRQIEEIKLSHNSFNGNFEGYWNGDSGQEGVYLFLVTINSQAFARKFVHLGTGGIVTNEIPSFKSTSETTDDEAISRYIRNITSPFTEAYEDTVYVHEDMTHYFEAELEHLPIDPTSIDGTILVNGEFPAYNANIQIKNLTNEGIVFSLQTDANGGYDQDDMPVPIDEFFSNPETTKYRITTTAQDPNNFEQKIDTVDMISGENLLHNINVTANPINHGSLSGTILVNGEFPAYNANIHLENIDDPSIFYDIRADTLGQFMLNDITFH